MNEEIIFADKTYELVSYFDSDEHCDETREHLKSLIPNIKCLFDSSYKNQLTYTTVFDEYVLFSIDYRYGFKREELTHNLIDIIDEISIYTVINV